MVEGALAYAPSKNIVQNYFIYLYKLFIYF